MVSLQRYVIQLQRTIIGFLSQANTQTSIVMPDLSSLLDRSNDMRKGAVNVLSSQYQRMMQAVPLSGTRAPSLPQYNVENRLIDLPDRSIARRSDDAVIQKPKRDMPLNVKPAFCRGGLYYKCTRMCQKCDYQRASGFNIDSRDGLRVSIDEKILFRSHIRGFSTFRQMRYGCKICHANCKGEIGFGIHLSSHVSEDLTEVLGAKVVEELEGDNEYLSY